jgi:two-component system, OmpR family, response regulator
MTILLVEDDPKTALYVTEALQKQAYIVRWAVTGSDGFLQARQNDASLIIIDRMLPCLDGLSLLRQLREDGCQTPTLMLTAMADTDDRVEGLEAGADDYLGKPFAVAELLARVNALLRRSRYRDRDKAPTWLRAVDLELDLISRKAFRGGKEIDLQQQEFRLLQYLVENAGRIVTRSMLLENVWDLEFEPKSNIVESHMSRLRAKLDRGVSGETIHTVRGAGYTIHT